MASANELVTTFKFKIGDGFKKFDRTLKRTAQNTDKTTKRMGRMFKSFGRAVQGSMRHTLKVHGTKVVERDLKRIKSLAGGLKASLKGFAIGGAIGVAGGLTAGIAKTIQVGMETETMMARLSTVRGPQQAAKDFENFSNFAAETPNTLAEILPMFTRLSAMGMETTNDDFRSFGDIAAAAGKPLSEFGDMISSLAKGQTSMVDNFIGAGGINASLEKGKIALSRYDKAAKKTIKTLVNKGDLKAIKKFFVEAGKAEGVAGAMEALSKTTPGMLSTLKDNIDAVLRSFYNAGLKSVIQGWITSAISFAKELKPIAKRFGVIAKLKLKHISSSINDITKALKKLKEPAKIAAGLLLLLTTRALGLRAIIYGNMLIGAVSKLGVTLSTVLSPGLGAASRAMLLTTVRAWALQIALGGIVIALAALAVGQAEFERTGDSMLIRLAEKWLGLGWAMERVHIFISAIMMGFGDLASGVEGWGKIWSFWVEFIGDINFLMIENIKAGFASLWAALLPGINEIKQNFVNAWNLIKEIAVETGQGILDSVMGALSSIGAFLVDLPNKAITAFNGLVSAAKNAAANMPVIGGLVGMLPGFATGGIVPPGFPSDSFAAGLTSGEAIIPVKAVEQIRRGDPAGMAKVMDIVGSGGTVRQPAPSYVMPTGAVSASSGGPGSSMNISASIQQTIQVNEAASPMQTAKAVVSQGADHVRRELDHMAKQLGRRKGATA